MKYVWSVVKILYYLFLTFICFLFCLSLFTLIGGGITNGFVLDEETKGNISMLGVSFVLMIIGFFIHRESMLNVWDFFFSFGRFGVPLFLVCIIILIIVSLWMLVKDVMTFDEEGGEIAFGVVFFWIVFPAYANL
ncbi:MAG: hypothetical protein ACI35O_02955 [Bacillaceae bacterium]